MKRKAAATLAGILVAVIVVGLVEAIGHALYPPPDDINLEDPAAMAAIIQKLPLGALLFVVAGWICGALAGGFIAMKVARRMSIVPSLIVGAAMTAATIYTLFAIPHPLWMAIAGVVLPVPVTLYGAQLARVSGD